MGICVSILCESICCAGCLVLNRVPSMATPRFMHLLLYALVVAAAQCLSSADVLAQIQQWLVYGHLKHLTLGETCDAYFLRPCMAAHIVYAASLALTVYFTVVGCLTLVWEFPFTKLWGIKAVVLLGLFAGFLYAPAAIRSGYAEVARVLSIIWMMFQSLVVIELSHSMHEELTAKADAADAVDAFNGPRLCTPWRLLYVTISGAFIAVAFSILLLVRADETSCVAGTAMLAVTAVIGVGATILSLLEQSSIGLLPPAGVFAYSSLLCWYALDSHADARCNADAGTSVQDSYEKQLLRLLMACITGFVVVWCAQSRRLRELLDAGDATSRGFVPLDGTEAELAHHEPVEPAGSRALFCAAMALSSCYGAMVLTGWAAPNGMPEGASGGDAAAASDALESMYIKIAAQATLLGLQWRILWLSFFGGG